MIKKILALIIVIAIVGFYFGRNYLVKSAVEKSGDYALGTTTQLGSANLSLTGGSLELSNYEIPNPDGFSDNMFFVLKKAILDVEEGSLLGNEVVVESLLIDGIRMNIEQTDTEGNYLTYFNHIKSLNFGSGSESEQKIKIKKVIINNISLSTDVSLLGQSVVNKELNIDNFTMKNIGGNNGESASKVMATIFTEIVSKASTKMLTMPEIDLSKIKDKSTEALDDVKKDAESKLKDLGKSITGGK